MKTYKQFIAEAKKKDMKDFMFKVKMDAQLAGRVFGIPGFHKQGKFWMPGKNQEVFLDFFNKKLTEATKRNYKIMHRSYTDAVSEAIDYAVKNGYSVDDESVWSEISMGPKKPSAGKTVRITVKLLEEKKVRGELITKPARKALHFQVYGQESGLYELNAYIS